jgi:hypothetical protein
MIASLADFALFPTMSLLTRLSIMLIIPMAAVFVLAGTSLAGACCRLSKSQRF